MSPLDSGASCFLFCWFLYFKGIHAPSTPDAGASGNVIMDYFWGVELHPTIFGVNLKQLFNCRISMMGWSLTVLSFAARQHQDLGHVSTSMLVCVVLQVAYLLKFFHWESGYFTSLDIMHDRFGFYICWGVIAWVPGVYTITAQYLVKHPPELTLALAWSLPAGFSHVLPYFYLVFLTILLTDRAGRDNQRCRTKYGRFWDEYCKRVPCKILPRIY